VNGKPIATLLCTGWAHNWAQVSEDQGLVLVDRSTLPDYTFGTLVHPYIVMAGNEGRARWMREVTIEMTEL
jgi:hypothetical protein